MSTCCTRERTKKDIMYLPIAIALTLIGFTTLLGLEISIAYALGIVSL